MHDDCMDLALWPFSKILPNAFTGAALRLRQRNAMLILILLRALIITGKERGHNDFY